MILLAAACLVASCARSQRFTVNGTLKDAKIVESVDSVLFESELLTVPVKVGVTDGAFTFSSKVKKPVIAKMTTPGWNNRTARLMILEKGDISFRNGRAVGTPLNDAVDAFLLHLPEVVRQHTDGDAEDRVQAVQDAFASFVSDHKDDPCAVYAIMLASQRLQPDFVQKLISSASPVIQNDGEVVKVKNKMKFMRR